MASIELHQVVKAFGRTAVCRGINLTVDGRRVRDAARSLGLRQDDDAESNRRAGGCHIRRHHASPASGSTISTPFERDVAMVFQNYALYPHMSVAENIGFTLKLRRLDRAEIGRRVGAVAEALELGPVLDRLPAQLSGGQQQRVALGRAIVREPRVFLFDEPFSNLDAGLRIRMRAEVKELHQRQRVTSVFVTHDQEEALSLSDRIAIMREGQIEQFGTPEDVYVRPVSRYVARFIGSPPLDFLPGRIEAGPAQAQFRIGAALIPLSADLASRLSTLPACELAARPEHVLLERCRHSRDCTAGPADRSFNLCHRRLARRRIDCPRTRHHPPPPGRPHSFQHCAGASAVLRCGKRPPHRLGPSNIKNAKKRRSIMSQLFPVKYGPTIASDLGRILSPAIVVAQPEPWEILKGRFGGTPAALVMADSLERDHLEKLARDLPGDVSCVVGIGGGTAMDTAKWLHWRKKLKLFQIPSLPSVNACFTHMTALREGDGVRYYGDAIPGNGVC